MNLLTLPQRIADEATVFEAAEQAVKQGLHLVIDRHGRALITPVVFPGMQIINVAGERAKVAA
jgi:hypothetical protein